MMLERFIREHNHVYQRMMTADHHAILEDGTVRLNPYHIEGSVWAHTMMVREQCLAHAEGTMWQNAYEFAALWHDSGKPDVREVRQNSSGEWRIRFFGHEGPSFYRACGAKNMLESEYEWIYALMMIARHGDYNSMEDTPKNRAKIAGQFEAADHMRMVGDFIRCDHDGRIDSVHTPQEKGMMWSKSWIDEVTRSQFPIKAGRRDTPHQIVILIGPPGCGKTTYVNTNSDIINHRVLSRDDVLMAGFPGASYGEAWAQADHKAIDATVRESFNAYLHNRDNIVVDMTNVTRKSRRKWLGSVPETYNRKAVLFLTGYEEMMKRNAERDGKALPEYVINNMCRSFVFPGADEFDEVFVEVP